MMIEQFKPTTEKADFLAKSEKFSEYYPGGRIEEMPAGQVPEEAMEYFEFKSSAFISPEDYKPGDFENFFIINHDDGKKTYLAQQTKTYTDAGQTEKSTYFVDADEQGKISGRAELRFNVRCSPEDKLYFRDKPFVGWIETTETQNARKKTGLGTKRLHVMNAYSQMAYGLPLYSDTVNSPEMRNLWETLVAEGKAEKFKEGKHDRYKLLIKPKN